jgi:hypothetical protein
MCKSKLKSWGREKTRLFTLALKLFSGSNKQVDLKEKIAEISQEIAEIKK